MVINGAITFAFLMFLLELESYRIFVAFSILESRSNCTYMQYKQAAFAMTVACLVQQSTVRYMHALTEASFALLSSFLDTETEHRI